MGKVLIEEQYLHDIADSIRKMTGKKNPITTDSMAREIEQAEIVWDPEEKWQRPIDWPDYSQIDISDFEGMYFTYDTSNADHYDNWVSFYCECSGGYKVERGQIVNGNFVAEYTTTKNSAAVFEEWIESTITGYVVYRITPATSSGHIIKIGHRDMTATLRTDGRYNRTCGYQPILERYGRLPYLTSFSNWANYTVESDTILDLKVLTTLNSVWVNSYNIENINLTGYDSQVTDCSQSFYCCRRLRYLNSTDKFVTSSCTTMYYMFNECYCLRFIDCGSWDTSNVTRMDCSFQSCYNLYKLDVSNWNVGKVTILNGMFNGCGKLKTIDVSKWVVSAPTNYNSLFSGCYLIEELDLSGFTTTNVTNMQNMFNNCFMLKELDVSHFNTAKVTTMYYMFQGCRSLQHLDVSNFDTSKVTNFQCMFQADVNIKELDISNFDFSSCTNMNSFLWTFGASIKNITFPQNFTTAKITGSGFNYAFGSLLSLREIDLSDLDLSGVTSAEYTFRYNYSMEKCVLPTSLHGISNYFFESCRNLKTVVLPSTTLVTLVTTNAFNGCSRAKTIYVPDNLVSSYQTADNWKSLSNVTFAGLSTLTS